MSNFSMSVNYEPEYSYNRNNIHHSKFLQRINEINREQQADMRLLKTTQSRFHKQFCRYEPIPPSCGSEAKNVRMFETHTPGFCYKRNGDMRLTRFSAKEVQMHDFEEIRDMLFSNGEVDIEKVVCLHLLAAHFVKDDYLEQGTSNFFLEDSLSYARYIPRAPVSRKRSSTIDDYILRRSILMPTLTSAMKNARDEIMMVNKKNKRSPSERRIVRGSGCKHLPSYVIATKATANMYDEDEPADLKELGKQLGDIFFKPGKQESSKLPIYFNKEIERLVDSVLDVLFDVNPGKAQDMIDLAKNPRLLRNVMTRPEIHHFIKSLLGKTLVSGWDSFEISQGRLAVPPRTDVPPRQKQDGDLRPVYVIEVAETIPNLMQLICEIRSNVLYEARKYHIQKNYENDMSLLSNDTSRQNFKMENNIITTLPVVRATMESPKASVISHSKQVKKKKSSDSKVRNLKAMNYRATMSSDSFNSNVMPVDSSGFTITSFSGFVRPDDIPVNQSELSLNEVLCDSKSEVECRLFNCENEDKFKYKSDKNKVNHPVTNGIEISKPGDPPVKHRCVKIKRASFVLPNLSDIEKPLQKFKEELLNDEFLRGREYEGLLEQLKPRVPENEKQRVSYLNNYYSSRFKPETYVAFSRKKVKTVSEEKEELEQNFLDHMSSLQRIYVFRQLAALKNSQHESRGTKNIPFASYVLPVLSQKSVMHIVNHFNEKEKKLVFTAEVEGGLGMPRCYLDKPNSNITSLRMPTIRDLGCDNTKLNAKLTDLDLAKLKCEIAERETHKKYLEFLSKPVPK